MRRDQRRCLEQCPPSAGDGVCQGGSRLMLIQFIEQEHVDGLVACARSRPSRTGTSQWRRPRVVMFDSIHRTGSCVCSGPEVPAFVTRQRHDTSSQWRGQSPWVSNCHPNTRVCGCHSSAAQWRRPRNGDVCVCAMASLSCTKQHRVTVIRNNKQNNDGSQSFAIKGHGHIVAGICHGGCAGLAPESGFMGEGHARDRGLAGSQGSQETLVLLSWTFWPPAAWPVLAPWTSSNV